MLEIDGSYGEGGGQILRMAVALSALTGKSIRVYNIRAGRPNPGLKNQHVTAINAVAKLCNAKVKGLYVGSKTIEFHPQKIKGGEYIFDVGTAGSVTLVMQACLLPALMAEEETYFKIKGGTDVKWAPPWDYFQNVFLKLLEKMGCYIEAYLNQRGYYPVGGGEVEAYVEPCELHAMDFNEEIEKIRGIINIANLPSSIAERIEKAAMEELKKHGMTADMAIEETTAKSAGVGIVLWSEPKLLGSDSLGERGKPAEEVGKEAARKLIEEIESDTDLDEKAVDQLLPYLAITGGKFKARVISKHAETEMWLLKKFINVDFKIKRDGLYSIEVIK